MCVETDRQSNQSFQSDTANSLATRTADKQQQ